MLLKLVLIFITVTVYNCNPLFKESGEIIAVRDVILTSKVNARISKIFFHQGASVKKGTPVLKLDNRNILSQMKVKEQEIAVIESRLALAKIKSKETKREMERYKRLYEQKSISKQALDEHISDHEINMAEEEILCSQLKQQREVLNQLKVDNDEYVIYAPFDGTILDDQQLSTGHMVQPGENLFRFADLSELRVSASVPSIYWKDLKQIKGIKIQIEGIESGFHGSIHWISNYVEQETRNRRLQIKIVPSKDSVQLFPGAFAYLSFY
jgi:RND family efflux transporter MFP subunit